MDSENMAFLQLDDLNKLKRFNETCEDSQPYDVPKEKMQRLAELGLFVVTVKAITVSPVLACMF